MRTVKLVVSTLVLAALVYVGARPVGPVPALGAFLDPYHGVWAVAATAELPSDDHVTLEGLRKSVTVEYDDRGVPHIFAASHEDAARALGYVVARDRLFQLELQTRATAGTLSEVAGDDVVDSDRFQRAIGLAWSADREWAALDKDAEPARLIQAYADGVNAWIDQLGVREIPFEFRLLGATPQRWEPVHSLYLTRRMGFTLTYDTHELWRDDVVALVGERAAADLFPIHSPIQEPVQPGGRETYPWFDLTPIAPPELPVTATASARTEDLEGPGLLVAGDVIGSNNWVVGPSRSATGNAILAGDPHLNLSLPSIWYEVHIVVAGDFDVYGVTIPGVPSVVIGFNRDVAWSFTNVGADVLDYFREQLDDMSAPTRYRLDGAWVPLELRIERYRDGRRRTITTDTIYHTHRGPMRVVDDTAYSLRWTAHDPLGLVSGETFPAAARATDVDELAAAFEQYYQSAQNIVMADRHGNIAIRSTGWYPRRDDGRGHVPRDGTTRASDWNGRWPLETYPRARNPAQGFLASANQEPLDPVDNADYLGVNWPSPWRAMRINRLLRENSSVTVDDMRRFQTDPGNEKAEVFLAEIKEILETAEADGTDRVRRAVAMLDGWDRRYTRDNTAAVLFEYMLAELENLVWDELEVARRRVRTPGEQVLWRVVQDSNSVWCDVRETDAVETCNELIARSLVAAWDRAVERHGPPDDGGWRWGDLRKQNIYHLLGLPSLSALGLSVQGGPGNLNPSSGNGTHGASWRMVVELGDEVRARTIYPGGQSGNPVSAWYDDRIETWVAGELAPASLPRTAGELSPDQVRATLMLRGGGD